MKEWHPKYASVTPEAGGNPTPRQGVNYRIVVKMGGGGGKEHQYDTRIEEFDPPRRITLSHTDRDGGRLLETFELSPADDGRATLVRHTVDLSRAGIPLWLRAIMWFIATFGYSVGDGPLDALKRFVEQPGGVATGGGPR
jgi:hypothetical protein